MQQRFQTNYNLDPSQSVGANRMMQQAGFEAYAHPHGQTVPPPDSYPINTRLGKRDEEITSRGGVYQQQPQPKVQPRVVPQVGNPFDTLGIPRTTTDEMLVNDVYRKWVSSLHPDRGGDPRRFQEITRAYKMVLEVIQHVKNESFESLKRQAERDLRVGTDNNESAANPALAPLGHGTAFQQAQFNQVFQDHRMWSPEDDGYGDQMVSTTFSNKLSPEEMIMQRERDFLSAGSIGSIGSAGHGYNNGRDEDLLHKFNKQDFNSAFERRLQNYEAVPGQGGRGGQDGRNSRDTAMVVRTEPEEMTMLRNMGSRCTTLSVDKIDDFSSPFLGGGGGQSAVGASGGGGYTDYMRAFSKDSLITPHVSGLEARGGGYKTVKELEAERANLSFIPSAELLQARAQQEAALKEQDEMRWRNYMKHQESIEAHQQSIRNVLSDRSSVHQPPDYSRK